MTVKRKILSGACVMQDPLLGLSDERVAERLDYDNWTSHAILRNTADGPICLYVVPARVVSESGQERDLFLVQTRSKASYHAAYRRCYYVLQTALGYANGSEEGPVFDTGPKTLSEAGLEAAPAKPSEVGFLGPPDETEFETESITPEDLEEYMDDDELEELESRNDGAGTRQTKSR